MAAINAEIPAFIHKVLATPIPEDLRSRRFSITHFHHLDLLTAIDDLAPETKLLHMIDAELFSDSPPNRWKGTAEQLEKQLRESASRVEVEKLLAWNNACGTYLGRLQEKHPTRFQQIRVNDSRVWIIHVKHTPPGAISCDPF